MKRTLFNIASLLLAGALTLVSCNDDNEFPWDNTDSGATVLEAFGPKVNRLGDMTIIGKNLQNVQAVIFPEDIRVTDINRTSNEKISVVVPYEASAGKLTLELAGGRTLTSKADIIYVETFTPPTVSMGEGKESVRAGEEITIEGDYLYNVATVSFAGNVDVAIDDEEAVVEVDRHKIVVVVPKAAQSGLIKIADAEGINVYSQNGITVRQPQIKSLSPLKIKAGDKLTVAGSDVDLIESITFADGTKVSDVEVVSESSIRVEVPATAADGAVTATSYAGVECTSEQELTLTLPAVAKVEADRFKAGETVTITGTDLDLVTALAFSSVAAEFEYDAAKKAITAVIPATAADGVITLTLANAATVETEALTFVKAAITQVAPTDLMAGSPVTVTGTDLDLVTGVKINGADHEFSATETTITITTSNTSQSGKILLSQANGVKTESSEELHFTYDSFVVVTSAPQSAAIGDEITITGSNFNMIEAIYFGEAKVTSYTKREDGEMSFMIPSTVETGTYPMTFHLTTGEVETSPQTIELRGAIATIVIWEGEQNIGITWDWSAGVHIYDQSLWRKVPVGATLNFDFACDLSTTETWYQLKLQANGALLPSFPGNEWGTVDMAADDTTYSVKLAQEDFDAIWAGGLNVVGHALIIKKIYVTYQTGSTDPVCFTDLMLVDYEPHGNHNGAFDGSWGGVGDVKTDAEGNSYIESLDSPSEQWLVNCNHQSDGAPGPVVEDASLYVVKYDVMIPDGVSGASNAAMQVVLGDGWNWIGTGFFPETTGGKWITVTVDALQLSGALDCSSGTNGIYGGPFPAGICIDNMRLSLK